MILEILGAIVALDIGWLINFVISNPLWILVFAALCHFMHDKRTFFSGTILALYLHALVDFVGFIGWSFGPNPVTAPIVIFFGLLIFDSFFGKTKFMAKRGIVTILLFYGFMVFWNIFVG